MATVLSRAVVLCSVSFAATACASSSHFGDGTADGTGDASPDGQAQFGDGGVVGIGCAGKREVSLYFDLATPASNFRLVDDWDQTNELAREVKYANAGPDGIWDTADDVVSTDSHTVVISATQKKWLEADKPGPDGVWETSDDHLNSTTTSQWVGGRPVDYKIVQAGKDGILGTADDLLDHTVVAYGNGMPQPLEQLTTSQGPLDQVFEVGSIWSDRGLSFTAAGPDGVWGTSDDVLSSWYSRELSGLRRYITYSDPGPDKVWFTADDTISSHDDSTCTNDVLDIEMFRAAGSDGTWLTSDDVVGNRWQLSGCPCGSTIGPSANGPPH